MIDIDEVIAGAKFPERTLALCLRGDLQAEWEGLDREFHAVQENASDESLAGNPEVRGIADRMEAIAQEMRDHEVVFRFRGLSKKVYSDLLAKHRAPEDERDREGVVDGLYWDTYTTALIATCAVDPKMSIAQAGRLSDAVTDRQWDDMFATALAVNRSQVSVPFSLSASAIRASTGRSSKRPEPGASPEAGSSDESLAG